MYTANKKYRAQIQASLALALRVMRQYLPVKQLQKELGVADISIRPNFISVRFVAAERSNNGELWRPQSTSEPAQSNPHERRRLNNSLR